MSVSSASEFYVDEKFIAERAAPFEALVGRCSFARGRDVSYAERERKGLFAGTLVYSEVSFQPFAKAFLKIRDLYGGFRAPGGKFYDIGSGTGKPVFAASLLHPWEHCLGVEMLEGLYTESLSLLAQWNSPEYQATLPAALRGVTRISMIHGDATIVDWSEADLVFMNSTCYDDVLLNKLVESSADAMKVGSFAVTFTKQLPSAKWKVLDISVETMSWGVASVFIQRKVLA